jgi:hypothetical protein
VNCVKTQGDHWTTVFVVMAARAYALQLPVDVTPVTEVDTADPALSPESKVAGDVSGLNPLMPYWAELNSFAW